MGIAITITFQIHRDTGMQRGSKKAAKMQC
jgi:hypothetical protein